MSHRVPAKRVIESDDDEASTSPTTQPSSRPQGIKRAHSSDRSASNLSSKAQPTDPAKRRKVTSDQASPEPDAKPHRASSSSAPGPNYSASAVEGEPRPPVPPPVLPFVRTKHDSSDTAPSDAGSTPSSSQTVNGRKRARSSGSDRTDDRQESSVAAPAKKVKIVDKQSRSSSSAPRDQAGSRTQDTQLKSPLEKSRKPAVAASGTGKGKATAPRPREAQNTTATERSNILSVDAILAAAEERSKEPIIEQKNTSNDRHPTNSSPAFKDLPRADKARQDTPQEPAQAKNRIMSINAILAAVTDRGNDAGSAQASTSNNHHVAATAQSLSPVHPHHPIEGSPASSESSRMERARQEASQEVSGLKTPTRPKLSISTTSSNSANALDMLANVCGTMPLSAIPTSATTSTPFPRPCRKLTTDENDSVLQVARKELGYLEDRLDSMSTSDRRPLSQLLQDEPPTSPDAVDGPLGITYTNSSQEGDGDAKDLPSRHPQHSPSPPAMRNATRKRQKIVDSDEESLASALLGDSVTDDKKVKQEVPSQPAKKALPSFKKKNQAGSAVKGEDSVKSSQESDRPRGREKTKERKEQVSKPAPVGPSSLPTRPQANGLPPKPSAASAAVALRPGERPLPPEKSSADVDVASFMQSFMHAGSSGPGAAAAASASREAERAEIEARKKAALEAREAEYAKAPPLRMQRQMQTMLRYEHMFMDRRANVSPCIVGAYFKQRWEEEHNNGRQWNYQEWTAERRAAMAKERQQTRMNGASNWAKTEAPASQPAIPVVSGEVEVASGTKQTVNSKWRPLTTAAS